MAAMCQLNPMKPQREEILTIDMEVDLDNNMLLMGAVTEGYSKKRSPW